MASRHQRIKKAPVLRFWKFVQKTDACWLWIGAKGKTGYGSFRWDDKTRRAHQASWIIHNGPIPDGLHVLHKCPGRHNPACVNPEHLYLGTHQQNMIDAVQQGSYFKISRKGENNAHSKLDNDDVEFIRNICIPGSKEYNCHAIAKYYGVTPQVIWQIVTRRIWAHLP